MEIILISKNQGVIQMSKSFICNLTRCAALVLPVFLLSAQPILASEGESVNSPVRTKQQSIFESSLGVTVSKPSKEQGARLCVQTKKTNPQSSQSGVQGEQACQTILKTKPQGSQPTTENNNLVQPQSGRRGFVYFNLINRTSVSLVRLFVEGSGSEQPIEVNLLGGYLLPGEIQRITVTGYNTCYYNLGLIYADEDSYIRTNVNLCSIQNYILYEE